MKKLFKSVYYVLNWTWGILMNIIGAVGVAFFKARGYEVKRHGGSYYVLCGGTGWGGVSFGMFFFYQENVTEYGKNHEYGHSLQNCLWGPLFPFVISIPSAVRYWNRRMKQEKGIKLETSYDDIWFEGQATKWGTDTAKFWD